MICYDTDSTQNIFDETNDQYNEYNFKKKECLSATLRKSTSETDVRQVNKGLRRKCKMNPKETTNAKKSVQNNGPKQSVLEKKMSVGCSSCRFKCSSRISYKERQHIFEEFWRIGNHTRQWDYLDRLISIIHHKSEPNEHQKQRTIARQYFLMVEKNRIKVCQTMFLSTFGISTKWLESIQKKKKLTGQIIEDGRGKHSNRPKRIRTEVINSVEKHIDSAYMSSDLNVNKMDGECIAVTSVSKLEIESNHYRELFGNNYSLSFQKSENDECDQCSAFNNLINEEKLLMKNEQDQHLRNTDFVRYLMNEDKEAAIKNPDICCISLDLQKILNAPYAASSSLDSNRKISIYNFSIFNLATKEGKCFIWNETIGKRGANEIASCLWKFIQEQVENNCREFHFYSDSCGGLNRNSILYTMYMKAALNFHVTIKHRYLVKGHTQTEGNCIHSIIEIAVRDQALRTQDQWCNVIRSAKVDDLKYQVHQMEQSEIFNFSKLVSKKQWKNIPISKISGIEIIYNVIAYEKDYSEEILKLNNIYQDEDLKQCYDTEIQLDETVIS